MKRNLFNSIPPEPPIGKAHGQPMGNGKIAGVNHGGIQGTLPHEVVL
jgi:hypothetical protein